MVSLDIYSVDGKLVTTLVDEALKAGSHEAVWNGRNDQGRKVPSGVYFYQVAAGENESTQRMLLLK